MRRRALLRRVAAGSTALLAGCPSVSGGSGTETADPTRCESIETSSTPANASLSTSLDVSSADAPVTAASRVVERGTDDHPARIELVVRNVRDVETDLQFGVAPPLAGLALAHAERDASLVLLPDPRPDDLSVSDEDDDGSFDVLPDGPTNGCWTAVDEPSLPSYFETRSLGPCDVLRSEFLVLGHPSIDDCPPTGRYARADGVAVRDEGAQTSRDAGTRFDLELSVTRS